VSDVVVPKLNNNDDSYTLIDWLVTDGRPVQAGSAVAVVETSKTAEDLVCDSDGVLHRMLPVNAECRYGDVIGRIFATEDERQRFVAERADPPEAGSPSTLDGILVTDAAAALAQEHGLSAQQLRDLGRKVVKREDVERLAAAGSQPSDPEPTEADMPEAPGGVRHALPRAQQAVAAVVSESHRTVPAAFAAVKVDVSEATELARRITRRTRRLVGLPELLVKAVARQRARFPLFFATGYDGRSVQLADAPHVGVTVDVGTGLFIPVVHDAERMPMADIADLMMDFREKATQGGLRAQDLSGGNIMVSLHNDADVVLAGPIVFPGQVCAVSLGGVQGELALDGAGEIVVRRAVNIGIVYDHRVVNGRDAVMFLREIQAVLESPAALEES